MDRNRISLFAEKRSDKRDLDILLVEYYYFMCPSDESHHNLDDSLYKKLLISSMASVFYRTTFYIVKSP